MTDATYRRAHAVTLATSVAAAAALWEIVGRRTSDAFMAPLSATLSRLVEMARSGELERRAADSLVLFFTGLGLAVVVGMPLGLLLARVFDIDIVTPARLAVFAPFGIVVYYLAGKYLVGYFNAVLGIA
jgi:ABC-type nitrate/sulfonate/bicarbonate transport system permease component